MIPAPDTRRYHTPGFLRDFSLLNTKVVETGFLASNSAGAQCTPYKLRTSSKNQVPTSVLSVWRLRRKPSSNKATFSPGKT